METVTDFASLLVMVTLALVCPILADRIPRHIVPETVFLLMLGAAFGPYGLGLIETNDVIGFLSELGCGFLFLIAGREIEPSMLSGHEGRRGLAAWGVSFAVAAAISGILPRVGYGTTTAWATAIMLTTTAIGTLMPILAERGLVGTPVGDSVVSYGTWGEICPIVAIAMLLSTRVAWQSAAILLGLVLLCVLIAWRGAAARRRGSRVYRLLVEKANSTAQTMVRLTMFLLVLLVTVSAVFDVDIVLGAFAAGFVLQYLVPKDDEAFDQKLNGMGYGFFIPVFFIYSGTKIDVTAVAGRPLTFAVFILALLLVRSVPVFVLAATDRGNPRWLSVRASASVAVYCATALPLVVAVTTIAVGVGAMSQGMASVLVAAGAVTVFLMPLLGQLAICAAGASELDVATLAEDTADLGPAAASAATAAVAAPAGSAAGAASAAGVAPAAPAGVATGAPEARGRHAAAHGHAHERHAARIALRMHIERMIESGESPEAVARYLAEELHFEGDEHRVHAVERRIERMQGSHRRVY